MGLTCSAQLFVSALAALFLAPRIASVSPRRAMSLGIGVILLDSLLTVFLQESFWPFAFLRTLDGAAFGLCISTAAMIASRTRRPRLSFTWLQVSQIAASMVLFSAAAPLVGRFGLAGIYGAVAGMAVIAAAALSIKRDWGGGVPRVRRGSPLEVTERKVWFAWWGIGLSFCLFIALVTNASALGARAGLTLHQLGIILALSTPFSIVGALSGGLLGRRVPPRWLLMASAGGTLLCGILLGEYARSFSTFAVALCAFLFFLYLSSPTIFARVSKVGGTSRAAAGAQAAQLLGLALGPMTGALLAHASVELLCITAGIGVAVGIALASGVAGKVSGPVLLESTNESMNRVA